MEYPNLSEEHIENLLVAAVEKRFPRNVRCPNRCRFCYEANFSKLFPWIKTIFIPPFTEESFNIYLKLYHYFEKQKKLCHSKRNHLKILLDENYSGSSFNAARSTLPEKSSFVYRPCCDFFCLGLSPKQIEILLKQEKEAGRVLRVATTGLHADVDLIKYFSIKYPNTFRLHLSIITFDTAIRKKTMNSNIDVEALKAICNVAVSPTYIIMCFNEKQFFSDIDILNETSIKTKGTFLFLKLYYNKLSPKNIVDYAHKGEKQFMKIVFDLKENDEKLKYISKRSIFCPLAKIYAWRWRKEIIELLKECKGAMGEAVFCSRGAYEVIRDSPKGHTHVIPMKTAFRGNIDFTLGIRIKDIISEIRKKRAQGILLKKVFIPSSIFFFKNERDSTLGYDINGHNISLIKKTYPTIDVSIIHIPDDILNSAVSLDDCIHYYEQQKNISPRTTR